MTALALASCGDDIKGNVSVDVPAQWHDAVGEMVTLTATSYGGLTLGDDGDFAIALAVDASIPSEGYRIDEAGENKWTVSASDVLGAQYGLSEMLEDLGFRFRHPFDTYVPRVPKFNGAPLGVVHQPQVRERGIQLHTLHPIEGYFAFWEPSAQNTNDAHRIIDWLVKNRGNFLLWVGLDNIMDPAQHDTWKAYTQELITYAHIRGIRVGFNIQLFGSSNLQLAFDLTDDDTVPLSQSIAERLPLVTQDLPWDELHLSFGEFFGVEPQVLIDGINEFARQAKILAPQAELHGTIHVGATQRVDYMGENLIYYFLLKFADPSIVPDVHSVMYYNLYDDAGGAYQHDNFDEHKQFLLDRMCAGKPAVYTPESGYWVAFDNSIPTYLPVYVYSRWRDIDGLESAGCGPLDNHMLFSTGWEWGYWLHDWANLHDVYEHATQPSDLIASAYAPDLGSDAAALISDLMNEQKTALIDERLAAYIASRDVIIDAGRMLDPPIISQPDRVQFDALQDGSVDLDAFDTTVMQPLKAHADAVAALDDKLAALELPSSRWTAEVRDGFAIDRLRSAFAYAVYAAALDHARGQPADDDYARAEQLLAEAQQVVTGRHADLHDWHGRRLVSSPSDGPDIAGNRTYYQYGYLYHADFLCYWHRELDQVGNILGKTSEAPPGCLFGNDRPRN
jgi:hypothetical protein